MPDNNNVLFGAQWEGSGFLKGTEDVISQLKKMQEANADLISQTTTLKEVNNDLTKAMEDMKEESSGLADSNKVLSKTNAELARDLKFQETQLKSLEKAYSNTNKSSAVGRKEAKDLSTQMKQLKGDMEATVLQINKNNTSIDANTSKVQQNKKAIADNTVVIRQNSEAIKLNETTVTSNNKTIADSEKAMKKLEQGSGNALGGINKLYSGLRKIAYVIPGIGIGGLIALIAEFGAEAVTAFINASHGIDEFAERQKIANSIQEKAVKDSADGFAKLELFRAKLNDLSIPEKERLKVLEAYNKEADKANQIDKSQIENLDLINEKIKAQISLLQQRAIARAAEAVLGEKAEALFRKQLDIEEQFPKFGQKRISQINEQADAIVQAQQKVLGIKGKIDPNELLAFADLPEAQLKTMGEKTDRFKVLMDKRVREQLSALQRQKDIINKARSGQDLSIAADQQHVAGGGLAIMVESLNKAQEDFNRALQVAATLVTPEGLTTSDAKTKGAKVENVFLRELARLREAIASASAKDFESDTLIENKFKAQYEKELQNITEFLKKKQLTPDQAKILGERAKDLFDINLEKALGDFHKKQKDALDKINDAINQSIVEDGTKRVANIRDEFEREAQSIQQGFEGTITALEKKLKDLTKSIDEDVDKGLLTPAQAKQKRTLLTLLFEDLFSQAEIARANAQIDLAFKTFQNTIKEGQRFTDEILTQSDEVTADRIGDLTQRYIIHKISYEKYQKAVTQILREQTDARNEIRLTELRDELDKVNKELASTTDPTNKKKLEDQQRQLREQIATLRNSINQGAAKEDEEDTKKKIQNFIAYANAIEGVLQSVVGFWNQVNQVEAAALDRSIAIQNRRVQNAKDIALKGNAEYLELEQKRLDELERKREENAKKQIAINNALTLSQATVAAISAIAQAVSTGSPLLAIAALAAVIGAIGAAFSFVNSLQPQSTNFYEGTEFVEGTGRPRGKDTVPARLNIGERVTPTDTNLKYWDSLHAIHNHAIPAEVLNSFVNSYPSVAIPTVDFGRLNDATNGKLSFDSFEVVNELKSTNKKLDAVVEAFGAMGFSLKIDEDGFAASINKAIDYKNKLKKA